MASDIVLSPGIRQNLLALQNTADLLGRTQNRLATGKKVNSALDNPSSFFTAASLTSRSTGLSNILDQMGQGVQTLQAANAGITALEKLIQTATGTARQALADKSATGTGTPAASAVLTAPTAFQGTSGANSDGTHDYSTGAGTVFTVVDGAGNSSTVTLNASTLSGLVSDVHKVGTDDVVKAINNQLSNDGTPPPAAVTASKTGDGRIVFTSTATGATSAVTVTNTTGNSVDIGYGTGTTALAAGGADAKNGGTPAIVTGTTAVPATIDLSGTNKASFTIQLGSGAVKTINLNSTTGATPAATTRAEILTAINNQIGADTGFAGKVTASYDASSKLVFTSSTPGSDQSITVNASASGGTQDIGYGIAGATTKAVTAAGTGSVNGVSATRTSLAQQFNDLLDQIDQQAQDATYSGTNLIAKSGGLNNTLRIVFNENNTSYIDVKGVSLDSDGLGLSDVSGNFQTDGEINGVLDKLKSAENQLQAQASTFGANLTVVQNRQDFTKSLVSTLQTGSDNLTLADTNEEGANLLALQTRQSLSQTALSLSSQADQSILKLFG